MATNKLCPECEEILTNTDHCRLCGWQAKPKSKKSPGSKSSQCCAGQSCKLPVTVYRGERPYCTYHHKNRNNPYLFKLFPTLEECRGESPKEKLQREIEEDDLTIRPDETRQEWLDRLAAHRRESMRRYEVSQAKFKKAMDEMGWKDKKESIDDIPF